MPQDVSLPGGSVPNPCCRDPSGRETHRVLGRGGVLGVGRVPAPGGPSWERRVGSFVSSTRLSICPRPLSPEKGSGEESHGGRRQMPAERKTRASTSRYSPRTGGSIACSINVAQPSLW